MKGILLIVLACFIGEAMQAQEEKEIWVGCEYFNGWWQSSPNKWQHPGGIVDTDWRAQYPNRIPLLGEYNSQETMDKEIKAAAEYGVDFFAILYYYGGGVGDLPHVKNELKYLNDGLPHFMNSPNASQMKFMIELTNHVPFPVETMADWDKCMDVFIKAMKHPSYLRVDGRAVFKIHSGHHFYVDLGKDIEKCNEVLNRLRDRSRNEGVGELLITVGVNGTEPLTKEHSFVKMDKIDATMQYMDPTNLPQKETDYSYELLSDRAQEVRNAKLGDALPYVPFFPAGWNPRPWGDKRAAFSFPTKTQWKTSLEGLKADLIKSTNLGFPKKDGTVQKAFTIYAWNEYGEGGILAPNTGDKYMKLEVLKEVFGE